MHEDDINEVLSQYKESETIVKKAFRLSPSEIECSECGMVIKTYIPTVCPCCHTFLV